MATFNVKQFVQTLTDMGFTVKEQKAVCEAYRAMINTENGTFEMIITDGLIRASKPNGTEKYWDNLSDARARSYVRQVLEFNKPVIEETAEEEEAEETAEQVTEAIEQAVETAEVRADLAETSVTACAERKPMPKWQLADWTVKDLRWLAKHHGLKGYSKLCKDELVDLIYDFQTRGNSTVEATEATERTLTAESAEHLAYIDRKIADAEAELEAAEEEYADAETENVDAHSFPDCFDVDLSDQRLADAERRLADAKEDLEAVRWEREDYLTDWAKYEDAPEAVEWAESDVRDAKDALIGAWDALALEEGADYVTGSLTDLVNGYRSDPLEDMDAHPEVAEALGIDPCDPSDPEVDAWAILDLEAAREWLSRREGDGNARTLATDPEATYLVPEDVATVGTGDDAREFLRTVLGVEGTPFEASQTGDRVSFTFIGADGLGYWVAYAVSERDGLGLVTVSGVTSGRAEELDEYGEPEFAPLTEEQEDMLEGLGVGRLVITEEQVAEVSEGLGLDRLSPGRLTPVRNAVVRHLSTLMSEAREAGDWDRFDQLGANLSGACAVIDRAMTRVA